MARAISYIILLKIHYTNTIITYKIEKKIAVLKFLYNIKFRITLKRGLLLKNK